MPQKLVNGEVVDTDDILQKKKNKDGFIDNIAEFFWSIFAVIMMFFQTICMPRGGQHKPMAGRQRIKGIDRSGTFKFRGGG